MAHYISSAIANASKSINTAKDMKTTYHYLVQLNGKGVKMGTVTFMNDAEEDAFVQKMEAKYMRNEDDLVYVMFR